MTTVADEMDGTEVAGSDHEAWWSATDRSLTGVMGRLDALLDELVAVDPALIDRVELGDGLVAVQTIKAKLCAAETMLLGSFDRARAYRADGAGSTAAWLAARSRTPRQAIQGLVRLSRRLRRAPGTRAALRRGAIDQTRAEMLAQLADSPRKPVAEAFPGDEDGLVDKASELTFDELRRELDHWRDRVDPDDINVRAQKDFDQRRLHLSQSLDGQWFLDGLLDRIGGQEIATALGRVYKNLLAADRQAAEIVHGEGCAQELFDRTPAQRRADALLELCRRAVAMAPGSRPPRPLVSVLVGYETFRGPIRETFNGTVLAPWDIARLLTDADMERVVFTNQGRDISDLGRRSRFFNDAQRRAIEVRDRTCGGPSCGRSAEECDMDHCPVSWADGGRTDISNGRPGCEFHNRIDQHGHGTPGDRRSGGHDPP